MIWWFMARRVGTGFLQLLVLVTAVFFLIRLLPADPVARFVGMNASPEAYASAKAHLGLDRPLFVQLASYLGLWPQVYGRGLLEGNLGTSWVTDTPVLTEVATYLPITLELITYSFLAAFVVALPLGIFGALRPGGAADRVTFTYGLFAGSQPEFWWALLFVYVFFYMLGWAPAPLGMISPMIDPPPVHTGIISIDSVIAGRWDALYDVLAHLMLPVITLAFVLSGPIVKMVRQNMARALQSEFVLYARGAGLSSTKVAIYALRVAFAPSMTLIGILYGYMLGGAVLVESVFSLGGLGQYAVRSILAFDYPAIQGIVLVITGLSLAIYLLLDLLHALIDPRVAV